MKDLTLDEAISHYRQVARVQGNGLHAGHAYVPKEVYLSVFNHLQRLRERDDWLSCLEAAGVDNWTGIEYAQELFLENED